MKTPPDNPGAPTSSADTKTMLKIIGPIFGGIVAGAAWMLERADRKKFEEVASRYPPTLDRRQLLAFWRDARAAKLEAYEEGLRATFALDAAAEQLAANRRLQQAIRLIDDTSCPPPVAGWVFLDAASHWFETVVGPVRRDAINFDLAPLIDARREGKRLEATALLRHGVPQQSELPQRGPILFLDVDGVLNVFGQKSEHTKRAVAQLHRVIEESQCDIVLSSTWRICSGGLAGAEEAIRERLGYSGKPFIGATPDLKGPCRGLEIAAWLASQPRTPTRWAVVDDDDEDMDFARHRLVRTNPRIGLDEVAADRLIEVLRAEEAPREV